MTDSDDQASLFAPLTWEWHLEAGAVSLAEVAGPTVTLTGEAIGSARLTATAWSVGPPVRVADAETVVTVADDRPVGGDEGIPEPELVEVSGQPWRSRLVEGRWQVNSGHPEYRALADRPALKLRYLALLFAKEIVLRSSQDPRREDGAWGLPGVLAAIRAGVRTVRKATRAGRSATGSLLRAREAMGAGWRAVPPAGCARPRTFRTLRKAIRAWLLAFRTVPRASCPGLFGFRTVPPASSPGLFALRTVPQARSPR